MNRDQDALVKETFQCGRRLIIEGLEVVFVCDGIKRGLLITGGEDRAVNL